MLTSDSQKTAPAQSQEFSQWLTRVRAAGQRVEIAKALGRSTVDDRVELARLLDTERVMALIRRLDGAEGALAAILERAADRKGVLDAASAGWAKPPQGLVPFTAAAFSAVHHVLDALTPGELREEWTAAEAQAEPLQQLVLPISGTTCQGCGALLREHPEGCPLCGHRLELQREVPRT